MRDVVRRHQPLRGDPPLAMAFLDRVVDGAMIVKINGKSYRAHRARTAKPTSNGQR